MTGEWKGSAAWLVAGIFMGLIVGVVVLTLNGRVRPAPIIITPAVLPSEAPTATAGPLRVYVSGQVLNPAVYQLAPGSIAQDAIRAAGGFGEAADQALVNLAQPLVDGLHIHVPSVGEAAVAPQVFEGLAPLPASLINLNTATQAELETLPGIGPTMAERIIEYRQKQGPFTSLDQILDVSGIGPATFEKIRELITVN